MAGGRRSGGQLANLNALKHQFYSDLFKQRESLDLDAMVANKLQGEIAMLRVVTW